MIPLARTARLFIRSGVFLAVPAAACDRPPAEQDMAGGSAPFTVEDSAGIEIVENHAPQHPPGQFWTIDAEPEIVLGGVGARPGEDQAAGQDAAQLIWEVVGIARLEDGRVAVLSQGNDQLYLFEPSGELSATIGRRGEGPGEFTQPEALHYLAPDTLVVCGLLVYRNELFRHRRGAPPGARLQHPGADGPGSRGERRFRVSSASGPFVRGGGRPPPDEPRRGSLVGSPRRIT